MSLDLEREYLTNAFEAVEPHLSLLPAEVQRKLRLAKSVFNTHGMATGEELQKELGNNWVVARRTKNIVARYGEDVKCYSSEKYDAATRRAIEKRFPL